jgi:hypothetical protein
VISSTSSKLIETVEEGVMDVLLVSIHVKVVSTHTQFSSRSGKHLL